jgi:hypothetical protein
LLLLGALDQTSAAFILPHAAIAEQKRTDRAFVREIKRRLPNGALVYPLPYLAFPEVGSPPGRSSIRLRTDAEPEPTTPARGDPRPSLYLRVIDPDVASTLLA